MVARGGRRVPLLGKTGGGRAPFVEPALRNSVSDPIQGGQDQADVADSGGGRAECVAGPRNRSRRRRRIRPAE